MSSPTTFTETFLTRARTNLTTHPHTPIPHLPSLLPNMSHTAIISCADPRVIPEQIFSLQPSDGVPVFRTIAGHPQPVVSGILALDHAIRIDEVIVLHHTDCGSTYFTEEGVKGGLRERCKGCEGEIDGLVFGAVENGIEQNLKEDAMWLREHPLIRKELAAKIRAFMWDLETGELKEVE